MWIDAKLLPVDMAYSQGLLLRLLNTPSTSGRTYNVMHLIGEELRHLGVPFVLEMRSARG
jgi:putative aminopeptidase FrvX